MSSSNIHTSAVGASTVISIKESLICKSCEELERVYNQLCQRGKNRIVLDFKAVPFVDSQALELLYAMHEDLEKAGGSLKVFGMNGTCRDILAATRLTNLFHVYEEMSEALRGDV
jgi:anti-sigma B factor antagonist